MTSPVRPTRKKKRGIVVEMVRNGGADGPSWDEDGEFVRFFANGPTGGFIEACHYEMVRAGLAPLKLGQKRKVRIIIEEP